jgi:hypothetical protein
VSAADVDEPCRQCGEPAGKIYRCQHCGAPDPLDGDGSDDEESSGRHVMADGGHTLRGPAGFREVSSMASEQSTDDSPAFLHTGWLKKKADVPASQVLAVKEAFTTREQLLDALKDGEDLTDYSGIGTATSSALWDWYKNVHNGEVEPDGTLVLDDDGLHLPDWLVGYVGTFTVETPSITMRPTTTDRGLSEVSSILGAYPDDGDWNDHLEAGQIGLSTPGHEERIYDLDDQRSDDGGEE